MRWHFEQRSFREYCDDFVAGRRPDRSFVEDLTEQMPQRGDPMRIAHNPRRDRKRKDTAAPILFGFGSQAIQCPQRLLDVVVDRQIVLHEKMAVRPFVGQRHGPQLAGRCRYRIGHIVVCPVGGISEALLGEKRQCIA